jgi:hypothetical protein
VTARICAHAGCSWLRVYLTLTNRIRQKLVRLEEFKVILAPTLDAGTAYEHAFLVSNVDVGHHVSNVDKLIGDYRSLRASLVDMEFPPWDDDRADRRTGANWCNLMPAAAVLGDEQTTVSLQCRRFWHQAAKEIAMTPMRAELSLYAN